MSNVVKLFPESDVQLYYVVDPGLTAFEIDTIISEIDIKNDACEMYSVEELKNEMLLKKLQQKQQLRA